MRVEEYASGGAVVVWRWGDQRAKGKGYQAGVKILDLVRMGWMKVVTERWWEDQ